MIVPLGFVVLAIAYFENCSSYIESGKRGCSVDLLVQLSELFGVSLDYLILGSTQEHISRRAEFNRLKADVENLIAHLEMFKSGLEEM